MRRGMLLLLLTCALTGQVSAQTGTWTTMASTPTPIAQHAVGVINGRLYSVGGASAAICCNNFPAPTFEYEPATNSWTTKTTMLVKRKNLAAGVVNSILYAVGGDDDFTFYTTNEAYDPILDTWTGRGSMLTGRTSLAIGVVNGKLYATGGSPGGAAVATVEAYDLIADTWTARAPMLQPRYYHGAAAVNGKLYVVGGLDDNGLDSATVEAYDPATNTWTSRAPMPTARHSFGIAAANGIIYAIGGQVYGGNPSVLSTVEAYNPATNTWTTAPSMPTARVLLSAGEVNGVIYAVGGIDTDSNFVDTVEAFTAPPSPPQVGPPTSKDQCKNGGWRGFSVPRPFKNQGDCIQFVNTSN